MMKHGNDQKLITKNTIDHRKRKPAKQYPTAAAGHERKHLWVAYRSGDCGVQSPCKFKAEACSTSFISSLCLQRFVSRLGPKEDAHSVIALEQFSADLIPWHGTRGILLMLSQSRLNCLQLIRRQGDRFRAFRRDAVPNISRKLDPFSNGEAEKIGSGLAHGWMIGRW